MTILLFLAAATVGTATPAVPEAVPPKKERIVCKSEKFVGSNMSTRICKTETEWKIGRDRAREGFGKRIVHPIPGKAVPGGA